MVTRGEVNRVLPGFGDTRADMWPRLERRITHQRHPPKPKPL